MEPQTIQQSAIPEKTHLPSLGKILYTIFGISGLTLLLPIAFFFYDSSLTRFIFPYTAVMLPLTLVTAWLQSIQKDPKEPQRSLGATLIVSLTWSVPFFIFASTPFTFLSFVLSFILVLLGVLLPFWSRKATLWFYTTGGLFPLPDDQRWLLDSNDPTPKKGSYMKYIKSKIGVFVFLAILSPYIIKFIFGDSNVVGLRIMKILSMIIIFSIGLIIGANLKKRSL